MVGKRCEREEMGSEKGWWWVVSVGCCFVRLGKQVANLGELRWVWA